MNLWHLFRLCRTQWFEARYLCANCDPEVLD